MPPSGIPLSYDDDAPFNFGDLNGFSKAMLFLVTLYLFFFDLSVFLTLIGYRHFKQSIMLIFDMAVHIFVLDSVVRAVDEQIVTSLFWMRQSWVALAVWLRVILTYLGSVKDLSWLIDLIRYSCVASGSFLFIFICIVTAFADSFKALEQRIRINNEIEVGEMSEDELKELRDEELNITLGKNFNNWLSTW